MYAVHPIGYCLAEVEQFSLPRLAVGYHLQGVVSLLESYRYGCVFERTVRLKEEVVVSHAVVTEGGVLYRVAVEGGDYFEHVIENFL